ncbi:MAG: hypothetical protein NTW16_06120 [Bacteroidetes bacterium]|nr:hypothetical protein [Bacteroidota bacterium]
MGYYQLRLTPVDRFFFGGEKHNSAEIAGYFVESNCYPQQTTLLGFTRYLLLVKHGMIGSPDLKTKAEAIIGRESFDFNAPDLTFGRIRSVSPLYFLNDEQIFVPAPLDHGFQVGNRDDNYFIQKHDEMFTAKRGTPELHLTDLQGKNPVVVYAGKPGISVAFSVSQTGNEKGTNGESKDDSFYKQTFMKLNPGWSFAIQVEIDDELEDETLFLPFGGEQSMFRVDIQKQVHKVNLAPEMNNLPTNLPGLYLLGDAFAESALLDLCCFSVNGVSSFRNFRSSVNTGNYSAFGKNANGLKRSSRYNLLSRGSVLYFVNEEKRKMARQILDKKHCINIGFNHWKLIN